MLDRHRKSRIDPCRREMRLLPRDARHVSRSSNADLRTPDQRFGVAELGELRRAKMRFIGAEKFVERRWRDRRAREHRVNLAAMMDLMFEQMREQARDGLVIDTPAPLHRDLRIELAIGEA